METSSNPAQSVQDVADLLGGTFPGHTMQRLRTADGKYRYSYVSSGVDAAFGLDPADLMARDAVDHGWVHADDRSRFVEALESSARDLTLLDEEVRVEVKGRGYKWVRSIGHPRRLHDGSVVWDGVALDVTDRREALEALERTLDQARRNEISEGRLAFIAANDFRVPLGELRRAVNSLTDIDRVQSEAVNTAIADVSSTFEAFERALSATRELVQAGGDRLSGQVPVVEPNENLQKLTPRQRQIVELVQKGAPNRLIAAQLGISEGTVKLHVSSILRRLKVQNRTEAVRAVT